MGVDARMLIGISRVPSLSELQEWGYRIGDAIGSEKFFWSHIGDAFSETYRALDIEPWPAKADDYSLVDGIDEDERQSACYLKVSLFGRYYGPGYERGNPWTYIAVAVWAERNLPDAVVWYGGDSDDRLGLFGPTQREALIAHWSKHGGLPYRGAFYRGERNHLTPTCPTCNVPASQFGFGGNYAAWDCLGCGQGWTWVGGEVEPRPRHTDSFKHAAELRAKTAAK